MMRSENEIVLALLVWQKAAAKENHDPTRHHIQGIIAGLEYALGKKEEYLMKDLDEMYT